MLIAGKCWPHLVPMHTDTKHRVVFMTLTFENDLRILQKGTDLQSIAVGELSSASGDWTMHIMFQPLPPVFAKHSVERGGNVLGLDRSSKSLVREFHPLPKHHA